MPKIFTSISPNEICILLNKEGSEANGNSVDCYNHRKENILMGIIYKHPFENDLRTFIK